MFARLFAKSQVVPITTSIIASSVTVHYLQKNFFNDNTNNKNKNRKSPSTATFPRFRNTNSQRC